MVTLAGSARERGGVETHLRGRSVAGSMGDRHLVELTAAVTVPE
jgi:hypothetical protein